MHVSSHGFGQHRKNWKCLGRPSVNKQDLLCFHIPKCGSFRCIDVQDKALSMAFNVVFLSLLAMLPGPMVYGAIIDNTCILWQDECGETTNCLLYDTVRKQKMKSIAAFHHFYHQVRLRQALMLTTAFIMLVGVFFDIAVCYYAKDIQIFNPEQNLTKSEKENGGEMEPLRTKEEHFASSLSISKAGLVMYEWWWIVWKSFYFTVMIKKVDTFIPHVSCMRLATPFFTATMYLIHCLDLSFDSVL